MLAYRRLKPGVAGTEANRMRVWLHERFGKAVIVAAPGQDGRPQGNIRTQAPTGQATPPNPRKTFKGTWKSDGSDYEFDLEGGTEKRSAKFEGRLLVIAGDGISIAFAKED
jgi:hypothetical protein